MVGEGHFCSEASSAAAHGDPSCRAQFTVPLRPLMLYTQSFSVATITEDPVGLSRTSGSAYTWPLTLVLKILPNLPLSPTVAGDSAGSLLSPPSRDRLTALVFTLAEEGPDAARRAE